MKDCPGAVLRRIKILRRERLDSCNDGIYISIPFLDCKSVKHCCPGRICIQYLKPLLISGNLFLIEHAGVEDKTASDDIEHIALSRHIIGGVLELECTFKNSGRDVQVGVGSERLKQRAGIIETLNIQGTTPKFNPLSER